MHTCVHVCRNMCVCKWVHGHVKVSVCLLFYALATSKAISGRVPTCDSAHSWRHYSAAPLGNQGTAHYPATEPTSPCPIIIVLSTWLESDKYQFSSRWFDLSRIWTHEIRIPHLPKQVWKCAHVQECSLVHMCAPVRVIIKCLSLWVHVYIACVCKFNKTSLIDWMVASSRCVGSIVHIYG